MKKSTKRLLAAVLSVVMILGALPLTALAGNYSAASPKESTYEVGDCYAVKRELASDTFGELPATPEGTKWLFFNEGYCSNPDHGSSGSVAHGWYDWDDCGFQRGAWATYRRYKLVADTTGGGAGGGETSGEPGKITATKELGNNGAQNDDDTYTIELTIQGNQINHTVETGYDVVLVMDWSGSMGSGYGSEYNNCAEDAKKAAKSFSQQILGNNDTKADDNKNKMALIKFSESASVVSASSEGRDAPKFTSDKSTMDNRIDALGNPKDGTNYNSALSLAKSTLDGRGQTTRPGIVVFITDGAPGNSGSSWDNRYDGDEEAAAIKSAGYTLYTIGIKLGDQIATKLAELATTSTDTNRYAYNITNVTDSNTVENQLTGVLTDIAYRTELMAAGTKATMTDIINSDYFELKEGSLEGDENFTVDENGQLVWNIGEIPTTAKTVKFKIKVKEDADLSGLDVNGELVYTNDDVNLTYTDPDGESKKIEKKDIGDPQVTLYGTQEYTLIYSNPLNTDDADVTESNHTTTDVTLKEIGSDEGKINFTAPNVGEGHKNVVFIGWSMTEPTQILGKEDAKPTLVGKVTLNADAATTVYAVWGYDDNGTGGDGTPDIYQVTATYEIANGKWKADSGDDTVTSKTETLDLYEKVTNSASTDYGKWIEKNPPPTLSNVPNTDTDVVADENYKKTGSWGLSTPVNGTTTITADTTFTYTLDPADRYTYTINYDGNGGEDAVTDVPMATTYTGYEGTYTLSVDSGTPSRTGFTFKGWADRAAATSAQYTSDGSGSTTSTITLTKDASTKTIYAVWEENKAPNLTVAKEVTSITRNSNQVWPTNPATDPKAEVGDTIVWTITVTNSGDAEGKFTLTDTLTGTTGTADVTTIATKGEDDYYTVPAKDGETDGTVVFTATYTVQPSDNNSTLKNKATITVPDNDPEPEKKEDEAEGVEVDSDPALSVTKTVHSIKGTTNNWTAGGVDGMPTAQVGDTIVWQIVVTNSGKVAGTASLTDTLTKAEGETEDLTTFYTNAACTTETTDFGIPAENNKTYYVKYDVTESDAGKTLKNAVKVGDTPQGETTPDVPVEGQQDVYVYFKTVDTSGNNVTGVAGVPYNGAQAGCWVTVGKIANVNTSDLNETVLKDMFATRLEKHSRVEHLNLSDVSWGTLSKADGANDYVENGTDTWHFDGTLTVYKLTYNANGGEGTVPEDENYYRNGGTASNLESGEGLTKGGQIFDYWATMNEDGSFSRVAFVTFDDKNVTLYAVYKDAPAAELSVTKKVYSVNGQKDSSINPNGYSGYSSADKIPTAKVGDEIIWRIDVINRGNAAGEFNLTDSLIGAGCKFYSDEACTNEVTEWPQTIAAPNSDTGAVGERYYVKYTVTKDDIGTTLVNTVVMKNKDDSVIGRDTAPGVPVGGLTVDKTVAGINVDKEEAPAKDVPPVATHADTTYSKSAKVGDTITWTITVTNYFDSAQTFTLEDTLSNSKNVTLDPASADGEYTIGAAGKNTDGSIKPTVMTITATYEVQASDEGKTLVNKAKVTPNGSETPIEDDADGVKVDGKLSVAKKVYSITRGNDEIYDLERNANSSVPEAKIGDKITWIIWVTNSGNETIYYTLADVLKGRTDQLTIYYNDRTNTVAADEVQTLQPRTDSELEPTSDVYYVNYTVKTSDYGKELINVVTATEKNEDGTDGATHPAESNPVEVEDKPNTPSYNPNYNAGVQLEKGEHFNYVIGYSDGTVRPEGNITRAEVATIFFRLLTDESRKTYLTEYNTFTDVEKSMWHNVAISTLARAGVLNGYDDGSFRPDNNITRAEMAAIISRFAELEGSTRISFTDIKGHWAEKSILLAASNGWINGYNDGSFRPDQNITRAETFAMINRVLERKVEHVNDLVSDMNTWVDNMDTTQWYYFDVQEATNYHSYQRKYTNTNAEKWIKKLTDIDWTVYQY